MKKLFSSIALVVPLNLALVMTASAQTRDKFVISAKAGGVNAISGRAEVQPMRSSDWQLLNVTDDLKTGDRVRTSNDGRVEMLLNPGSYLRMAENSEFELTDNSLENLEVKLARGVAIIEATGADQTELAINITTPQAKMIIVRRGLYRINVMPGNATELFVRKGRVLLADSHTKVKDGNKVIFSNTTFSVAKLEKADKFKDDFENWSKQRAETVAQANRRIPVRDVNAYFAGFDNYWDYRFSASSSGLWLFNPRFNCFTFLPFYFGWGSPYGASYSNVFNCGYCGWRGYNGPGPIVFTGPNGSPRGSGSGSGTGGGSGAGVGSGSSGSSGSGTIAPRTNPAPSSDWPGRNVGRPDINTDGPRARPRVP
jgi:uncharacterized membrane protein YgcG